MDSFLYLKHKLYLKRVTLNGPEFPLKISERSFKNGLFAKEARVSTKSHIQNHTRTARGSLQASLQPLRDSRRGWAVRALV